MNNIITKFNKNQLIKIVQWNCRNLRNMFPEFEGRNQNIDVIILSETWLDEADIVYPRGFEVMRKERTEEGGGGVAIFINNKLKYSRKDCGDGIIEACSQLN
jgi:exonuclease III